MKRLQKYYKPGFFKLLLILAMIWNIGAVQALFCAIVDDITKESVNQISPEERIRQTEEARKLVEEKIVLANQQMDKGRVYSPYDYFRDLIDVEKVNPQLGISVLAAIYKLQALSSKSIEQGIFSWDDIDRAREKYKCNLTQDLEKSRIETFEKLKASGWKGIGSWLLGIYLWNLLPVALLYLVWMLQEQEVEERLRFPKPLNFIWTVLAHPFYLTIIFAKWWRKQGREWRLEVEYRRTKQKLFVYLSDEEKRRIKEFAQSGLSIWSWRRLLQSQELRTAHSVAAVLCVMMLIAILPRLSGADSMLTDNSFEVLTWHQSFDHLPRMDIDGQIVPKVQNHPGAVKIVQIPKCDVCCHLESLWVVICSNIFNFLDVLLEIVHIPISSCESNCDFYVMNSI
jgi:hypothetical protein